MLMLAGEVSGDEHGASLAAALQQRVPGLRLVGIGGPMMEAAGVDLIAGLDDLAVMGIAEVFHRLPFFRSLEHKVRKVLGEPSVSLVILIAYPGFNLRIARAAKKVGKRALYYIAPKVWASRPHRINILSQCIDRMAVILPFEEELFEKGGIKTTFVGHPLLDRPDDVSDHSTFCKTWGLDPERPLLAILPGSRRQEVVRHIRTFVQAGRLVAKTHPDMLPVFSGVPGVTPSAYDGSSPIVVGDTRALLRHAHVALVKSGTSTIEAALEGTPSVVAYKMHPLTWLVAKRMLQVDQVSLPNLIAGEKIVPELLQEKATPEALAEALRTLIPEQGRARRNQLDGFSRVRAMLGRPGAAACVADLAMGLMEPD